MYVTPLASATSTDGVVVRQYSDESQACIEFTPNPDFFSQLQCCLILAVLTSAWLTLNRVFLNVEKCDILFTSTARQAPLVSTTPLQIDSSVIHPSSEAKNLGVTLDSHLTMSTHVRQTCDSLPPQPNQQDPSLHGLPVGQVRGECSSFITP